MHEDWPDEEPPYEQPPLRFWELGFLGRNDLWNHLLGLWCVLLGWSYPFWPMAIVLDWALMRTQSHLQLAQIYFEMPDKIADWRTLGDMQAAIVPLALLIPFLPVLTGLLWTFRGILYRPLRTVFTANRPFDWRGLFASLGLACLLPSMTLLPGLLQSPPDLLIVADPHRFLLLLPAALGLLVSQAVAEEALFRGYLLQMVRDFTARMSAVFLIPSALFMLLYLWLDSATLGGPWTLAYYAAFSLYLTWLALRGNGLEHAIGCRIGLGLLALLLLGAGDMPWPRPTLVFAEAPTFGLGLLALVILCAVHGLVMFPPRRWTSGKAGMQPFRPPLSRGHARGQIGRDLREENQQHDRQHHHEEGR